MEYTPVCECGQQQRHAPREATGVAALAHRTCKSRPCNRLCWLPLLWTRIFGYSKPKQICTDTEGTQRRMEGAGLPDNPCFPQSHRKVPVGPTECESVGGRGKTQWTHPDVTKRTGEEILMPVATIPANHHIRIPVGGASRGLLRMLSGGVKISVESERPIDVFVVDSASLADFDAVRAFNAIYTAREILRVSQTVRVPFTEGTVYVILRNSRRDPTAVYYEVT